MISWGIPDFLGRWRYSKFVLQILALSVIFAMMISASFQVSRWKDSFTLFSHALEATTNNYIAHLNVGVEMNKLERLPESVFHYREALRTKPSVVELPRAHYGLGFVLARMNSLEEAVVQFGKAIEIDPKWAEPHNDMGIALARQGEVNKAIVHFREALKLKPSHAPARKNLRKALQLGRNAGGANTLKLPDVDLSQVSSNPSRPEPQ